jgi:hypothetical protein
MEKAQFIEKARESGATQDFIDWAIALNETPAENDIPMPFDILLNEFLETRTTCIA